MDVQVIRSRRRRKTVSARVVGERLRERARGFLLAKEFDEETDPGAPASSPGAENRG